MLFIGDSYFVAMIVAGSRIVNQRHLSFFFFGEFEPKEGHTKENRLVKELKKCELTTPEDCEVGAKRVEESREVEDAAARVSPQGEAEKPLKRGLGTPPEPLAGAYLGGGEEDFNENDDG
ncbi:hypothetical protein NE237_025799 [Protea cynaroides]|uniref:Uncharacterized protein n=1 Tax=Protea cynaroides TaxID=273540 RepID=A0A9Q0H5J1_9MAGN|nr:hypothetical protein NE237_025799 [Protea cynaroides]